MKKFRVTVNGKTYEVEVEEIGGASGSAKVTASEPVSVSEPKVSALEPKKVEEKVSPAAPISEAPKSAAGGTVVSAPMPGKVLSVSVKEGDRVKEGDLLLILEAMKMENEILAPISGTIKQVSVSAGGTVNTGDLMVVIG
ncbi:MAG: biotin/lipoyl-binding protein [Synergistetes bacterium]|nr:biotin/lipoyl-binding protein [Synergistota bacterium]